jgi:diguanylate cyclase (GGDEF)-like protein
MASVRADVEVDDADIAKLLDGILAAGEVRAVYQPIVDLDTGGVVAYEALARGPQGSPLERPDQLFAAARRTNRLAQLDQACRTAAVSGAARAGLRRPWTLFVNVEPEVIGSHPMQPPDDDGDNHAGPSLAVVLELTERALTARPSELLQVIDSVRARGWAVALDDVGAERASLALMPLVRPDVIKLDLRLVQDQPNGDIAAIVNAVNAEAGRSGARILAEGIETADHVAVARAMGATLGQGWHFGRPAPLPSPLPPAPVHPLQLTGHRAYAAPLASPFDVAAAARPVRQATKPLLIEISKYLERQATSMRPTALVLAAFQHARYFSPSTRRRYSELAEGAAFVAALGEDMPAAPLSSVRGALLSPDDPVRGEWDIAVVGPHYAAALLARDLGDQGPESQRRFEFVVSYERDLVVDVATGLMSRVWPDFQVAAPSAAADVGRPGAPHDDPIPAETAPQGTSHDAAAAQQLVQLAYHDPLTGLPNRAMLAERLTEGLARADRHGSGLVLLFVDLDDFKKVNAAFGHSVGDQLLRQVGARLRSAVRRSDVLARYGGDEFLVLADGFPLARTVDVATQVAAQLHAALSQPFALSGTSVSVAASIGVALYPDDGVTADELLTKSDIALYVVKNARRTGGRTGGGGYGR